MSSPPTSLHVDYFLAVDTTELEWPSRAHLEFDSMGGCRPAAAVQFGRIVVVHVPVLKLVTRGLHLFKGAEVLAVIKGLAPQMIEAFDGAIAFGFAHRQEDQLHADAQTQPHELAVPAAGAPHPTRPRPYRRSHPR